MSATIHLQQLGQVSAKPVHEFQPGDSMGFNCGYRQVVERIEPRGKMADVYFVGHSKPNRMKLSRMAAIATEKWPFWNDEEASAVEAWQTAHPKAK